MEHNDTFGNWLRQRRRLLGMTQSELADCAGCSPITVRKMESDERRPSRQLAELLADCLQIAAAERARFVAFARQGEPVAAPPSMPASPPTPARSVPTPLAPPPASDDRRGNLPTPLTSFIGRDAALDALMRTLQEGQARPLTLVGPGGSGKTRLALEAALEAAAELGDLLPDGAWWVDLAAIDDETAVAAAVAHALGLLPAADAPESSLAAYLAGRRLVIVLDNCEHLIDACARLVERLLRRCPDVQILATSREALNVGGEAVFPVPTLSLPEPAAGPEAMLASEAVRLFVERATAQRPDFRLTADNAAAVAQICRRLDGIPLALELAAARVRLLPPAQVAARLDDRFALLTGGARTALPRQQTLRALVDWSHDLLEPAERVLFRRLATFAGSWTLAAAEQVAGDPPAGGNGAALPAGRVLDLLARLVDKSLVQVDDSGDEARFEMLETIRAYARERLAASGEMAMLHERHLAYYADWAAAIAPRLHSPTQAEWLGRLEREHDNLRLALRRALVDSSAPSLPAARLTGALGQFWLRRNYAREGARWTQLAAAHLPADTPPEAAGRLFSAAGSMAWLCSDLAAAMDYHRRALAAFRAAGNRGWEALSLRNMAVQEQWLGHYEEAIALMHDAVTLAQASGDRWAYGNCLLNIGLATGDDNRTLRRQYLVASTDVLREAGDGWPLALGLCALAMLEAGDGAFEWAQAYMADALQLVHELGDIRLEGVVWQSWGKVQRAQGEPAATSFRRSLALLSRTADTINIVESLEELALDLAGQEQDAALAARLLGTADSWRAQHNVPAPADVAAPLAAARPALAEGFVAAYRRGQGLSPEEAAATL